MSKKYIVQKYGGTSVGSTDKIKAVANRVKKYTNDGCSVVVVVSAMGKSTDELVKLAGDITENPSKREMDVLLSTGEQVSISLLAMALHEIGVDAISYTGSQVKVMTDGNYSNARIVDIHSDKIKKSLDDNKVVIVAGFQGVDKDENINTLGRGGSDTSAVALAAALGIRDCEICTDVDGVYTADPRIVSHPKKLNEISYEEMLELARLGAGVLHSRSVEFAKKYNVRLIVRSSHDDIDGTIVKAQEDMMEKFVLSGVTSKTDEAKFTIRDIPDSPGIAEKLFMSLGEKNIYVNMIIQSTGKENHATISFTVHKDDFKEAKAVCKKLKDELNASEVTSKEDIAIISAVGVGMLSGAGVAGRMFKILAEHKINIEMISTSEIGISCVIDAMYAELAVKAVHKEFLEDK